VLDQRPADVAIGANAWDFVQLARRQADPDSLFFSRRLSMEGDTELGLLVKNTLDAIDFAALFPGVARGARPWERGRATLAVTATHAVGTGPASAASNRVTSSANLRGKRFNCLDRWQDQVRVQTP